MDDAEFVEEGEGFTHPVQEVLDERLGVADVVVETEVFDAVDAFALEELALHLEQTLVQVPSPTQLVHQPQVLLILDLVHQLADMLSPSHVLGTVQQLPYLQLHQSGGVTLVAVLRELLHRVVLAIL